MSGRQKSHSTYQELCQFIPGGVNSPVRACKGMDQIPLIADYGFRDQLVDVDGHHYIDFCGSWGSLIAGHAHPQIVESVIQRMKKGTSFGVTTALEGRLAQEVIGLMKSVEKIRFVSSGTEATMSAVRLARGFTGKNYIIKFSGNYHGHADLFLVQAGSGVLDTSPSASSAGIPEDVVKYTICLPYNDIEACKKIFENRGISDQIAAVILEPVAGNMGVIPAEQDFVDFLRNETQKNGALLIFDEVITGFRVALGGAQEIYGVKPDLTCFGKIIGGGFPVAAFGGRKEIMEQLAPLGPVYQAGTLSGNPVAMEAGLQSLRIVQQPNFYQNLQRKTDFLLDPIKEYIKKNQLNACIQNVGSMFTLFFGKQKVRHLQDARDCDQHLFAHFFRTMFDQGIYISPSQHEALFISAVHEDDHLEKTQKAFLDFLRTNKI